MNTEIFSKSWFFTQKDFKKGEYIFKEGEISWCLFFIVSGKISIRQSTQYPENSHKVLWILESGNIIGEGSLVWNTAKKVSAYCEEDVKMYVIDALLSFPKFLEAYPKEAYEILLQIIKISNTRVLEADSLITASYQISCALAELGSIHTKSVYSLLEKFQKILQSDEILFFEAMQWLDSYFKLKFHTATPIEQEHYIFEIHSHFLPWTFLKKHKVPIFKHNLSFPLILWEKIYGYLVIGRKKSPYSEYEHKILENIAHSFVGIVYQKHIQDEENQKNNLKNSMKSQEN